jgi:excisionase family DNA binding protein
LKESVFKSYEELPLFLNAEVVGKVLGVSISSAYELMHEKDFPSVRIGNRFIVPKDKFIEWVNKKAGRTG